jgi:hypothetical protein
VIHCVLLREVSQEDKKQVFTPLESPAIYGGDGIDKILIPHRKGGVKAPSFLTGFTLLEGNFIMGLIGGGAGLAERI